MKRTHYLLGAAVATILAGCATTPDRIEELETARAVVPQVEASPRAGVAAANISDARKSLERANKLADEGGDLDDIRFEATVAARNAQIANEKILDAMAKDEISKGEAERTAVLAEARERDARMAQTNADAAQRDAAAAQERAAALERELADLKAKKTDRGMVLTLGDVLFDTGKATLKPGAYPTIERLAQALQQAPDRKVMIEGHTDSVGTDAYNQTLSEQRAQSVQAALMQRGVSGSQITSMGRGETTPVASNDDPGGRQQNRRVELIFADGSQVASDVN